MIGVGYVVGFILLMWACSPRKEQRERSEWEEKIEKDSQRYTERWF